eukprot:Sspe_Gene.25762::Locus_10432_Transcript_1_1_Confidence_1.000_Length_1479::g.25762::m.25762/K19953/GRTP1, TBC1D6, MSB3_4; TBC1 domain family member 6
MPILLGPILWGGGAVALAQILSKVLKDDEPLRDQYGFVIEDKEQHQLVMEHLTRLRESSEYIAWATSLDVSYDNIDPIQVARGGIPAKHRIRIWMKLSGAEESMAASTIPFEDRPCVDGLRLDAIEKDLNRTFPRCALFEEEDGRGQRSLKRILLRFAAKYDHGYAQSMNILAGWLLLLGCSEEEAFWIMDAIIQGERFSRDYYTDNKRGCTGLKQCFDDLHMFEGLLQDHVPALHSLFKANDLSPSFTVCFPWVICVFVDCAAPEHSAIIFDLYMIMGLPVVYNISLRLLKRYEEDVVGLDIQNAVQLIRRKLREETDLSAVLVDAVSGTQRITHDGLRQLRSVSQGMTSIVQEQQHVASAVLGDESAAWERIAQLEEADRREIALRHASPKSPRNPVAPSPLLGQAS